MFFFAIGTVLRHLEAVVGPVVEQHPSVVQQLEPLESRVTVLLHPPICAVVLEVPVSKIVYFGEEVVGPNLPRSVNSPRIVTIGSVDDLSVPCILAGGLSGDGYEGFNVGF